MDYYKFLMPIVVEDLQVGDSQLVDYEDLFQTLMTNVITMKLDSWQESLICFAIIMLMLKTTNVFLI
jgi:hypothetical protein